MEERHAHDPVMLSALELKVPPPAVAAVATAAMIAASWLWPWADFTVPNAPVLASLIALAGVAIAIAGTIAFRQAQTTVNPMKPETASSLVTGGVYAFTRNPMYLGLVLLITGLALYLANVWTLFGPVALALYLTRFQIAPEERIMARLFGPEFDAYASRVRRWI